MAFPDQLKWNDKTENYYLKYPEDLLDPKANTMFFVIAPYQEEMGNKGVITPEIRTNEMTPIFLPLPAEFSEIYSQNYSTEQLLFNFREYNSGGSRTSGPLGGVNGDNSIIGLATDVLARNRLNQLGNDIENRITGSVNAAKNYLHGSARASIENIYDSPNLRQWEFTIQFLPRNPREELAQAEIHAYLKFLESPTYNLTFQRFPAVMDIFFASKQDNLAGMLNKQLIFTKAVLISVEFVPTMLLTRGGGPIEQTLKLTFQECRPLDRDTIKREWESSGTSINSNRVKTALQEDSGSPTSASGASQGAGRAGGT